MQWLQALVDELLAAHPEGQILIESGSAPSGAYHVGHLREIITCDAILLEIQRRGREAKHIHFADDLDALRKLPVNIPESYEQYLGKPLCDVPAPDGSTGSYADFFLDDFAETAKKLGIEMEIINSHQKYRSGYFVSTIEAALEDTKAIKRIIEEVAGRQLDEHWSPVQVMENGYLKNRQFIKLDKAQKTIDYKDADGKTQTIAYDGGEVKLDWRIDWPARWSLQKVAVEPSGRDHVTKGGSYDTGSAICRQVYKTEPPMSVPYDFVNQVGDTKKMSASKGTGVLAKEIAQVLPAEVTRFFMLRYPPSKRLYFDRGEGVVRLIDEYAALASNPKPTEQEQQLLYVCMRGLDKRVVSRVPFSHLVASYQAALKDADKTLDILSRTEYKTIVEEDKTIILDELSYIDQWLKLWAPDEVKFELRKEVKKSDFNKVQQEYLQKLADKVSQAPADADGSWFHQAIYEFKDQLNLPPKELFSTLYQALIGKDSGPRAGWFLSILPRDWLLKRLRFEA